MGPGSKNTSYVPTLSKTPDEPIKKISTYGLHSLLLTESGKVWSCGKGTEGQMGNKEFKDLFSWSPIDYFINNNIVIEDIASGFAHNLALSKDGRVYSWGMNANGQLGLGDIINRYNF